MSSIVLAPSCGTHSPGVNVSSFKCELNTCIFCQAVLRVLLFAILCFYCCSLPLGHRIKGRTQVFISSGWHDGVEVLTGPPGR